MDGHFKVFAIIFIILLLLLIIRLIVVSVKLRNRDIELDDLYDEYGIDLEEEEEKPAPKKKNKKKAEPASKKGKKKKVVDEDDFDDYDDDEFDDGDADDEDERYDDDYADDDYADDDFAEEEFDEVREAPLRTVKFDDFNTITDMSLYEDENFESFMMDEDEDADGDQMVDDLDDLLSERPKEKRSHSEKDDTFQVDFIDLD